MLLRKHRIFHSRDLAKYESHLQTAVSGRLTTARLIEGGDGFHCNGAGLGIMPIFYLKSDIASTADFQPIDYIRLMFQTGGASRLTIDRTTSEVGTRGGSYILPEDQPVCDERPSGFAALIVRIEPDELKQRLEALFGIHASKRVVFQQFPDADQSFMDFVRRPLFAAAREIDASSPLFHRRLIEEIKEITLTRLLLFAPHNFSGLLDRKPDAPGEAQMKKAEEFIAAHWDKNLDVSALAEAVGVSGRTILRNFRKMRGATPRDHLRGVRLDRAQQMLLAGGEDVTVVGVALKCGFSSLGHFAEAYRRRFGELPSETLRGGH